MSETLLNPYFGEFGGMYVPEILVPVLQQLEKAFVEAKDDPEFQREFQDLLKNYAGRPTALTLCRNLTKGTKAKIYLKREDLLHGGAHKTNQVLGQILLAKRMGKTRIIAETLALSSSDLPLNCFLPSLPTDCARVILSPTAASSLTFSALKPVSTANSFNLAVFPCSSK